MKKLSSIFLVLFLVLLLGLVLGSGSFAAETVKYTEQAEVLKSLGLFNGTNVGFELERAPKRVEVAAMLVKFLGAEEEAKAKQYKHPFTDVPAWANHIVGYMYEKKLTTGIGNNLFGSLNPASAKDYTVFLLKALGYGSADFTYNETMNFAVSKGLYTAAEKATLESTTFKRDEMVFSSYKSLFTKVKGSTQLLSEKLGIASVPKIVAPVTATVDRVNYREGVRFVIDKNKLPEPYKNFVYIGVSRVYWTNPTTNAQINELIPTGKNESPYLSPYEIDGYDGYGAYWNTVVTLFDSEKRLIGYFDILGNNKVGTFTVNIRPVTTVQELAEIKTGVSMGSGGIISIDRNALPAFAKDYVKVAVPEYGLSDAKQIQVHSDYIVGKSTTKFYTTATIDGLSAYGSVSNRAFVMFYDGSNQLLGYASLDSAPLVAAMKNNLESKGIKQITKGFVVVNAPESSMAYVDINNVDYGSSQNLVYFGLGTFLGTDNIHAYAYSLSKQASNYLEPLTPAGISTQTVKSGENAILTYYDSNKKLVAYSVVPYSEVTSTHPLLKTVEVQFEGEASNNFSNSYFSFEYYKNGTRIGTSGTRYFELLTSNTGKITGVRFTHIFFDPNGGYEIKVSSNNSGFVIKSFEVK
ncbi:MAG: hypothetical protein LCH34_10365 [Firmicutes bacterium]|nr:hypothetical protein [Bacillota bacterium]